MILDPSGAEHFRRLLSLSPESIWEKQRNAEKYHQLSCNETTKLNHWDAWVQNKMHYFVLIHEVPLELPKYLLPTKIRVSAPQTLAIKKLWNAISFSASALQEHARQGGVEWRLSESICTIHYCSWYNGHISHNLSLGWLTIHMHLPLNNSCCFLSFLTIMTIYPC